MRLQKRLRNILCYNYIAKVSLLVLIFSLLPLVYCSFFDYATGDDLWEGAVAHQVLKSGGTLVELFQEVFAWMKVDYLGWQGNWSSTFLWCFSPNVFGEKVYCITPWIGLVSISLGHWYCFKYFNEKYLRIEKDFFIILYVVITLLVIQYMPYIGGGIFWYSAMINYTFPYGLTMAVFVWIDKYLELEKKKYLIFLIFVLSFLGGSGYLMIVVNFEIIGLVILVNLLRKDKTKRKRAFLLLIPFALFLIGFIISALAPGNAVRGGEDFGLSMGNILYTLKECIVQGAHGIFPTIWRVKILILISPIIVIGVWEKLNIETTKINFGHPILVTVFLFLISCSVYAPGIYSKDEQISSGVYDTIYYIFILTYFFTIIYIVGYFKLAIEKSSKEKNVINIEKKQRTIEIIRCFGITMFLVLCITGKSILLNDSAFEICIDYISSGQLADFEMQMQERLEILNDPTVTDVVLPGMNNQQGPFVHMVATEDPTYYTNRCIARFYGKKSVICIPRDQYYALYGNRK